MTVKVAAQFASHKNQEIAAQLPITPFRFSLRTIAHVR
jgi:hypothetical protein